MTGVLPVKEDGTIDAASFAQAMAGKVRVTVNKSRVAPTKGRVIKESSSGDVYVGDGQQWQSANTWLKIVLTDLTETSTNTLYEEVPDSADGTLQLAFEKPYKKQPFLHVTTQPAAIWGVSSWSTDGDGKYTGCTLEFTDTDGNPVDPTVDVQVTKK